MINWTQIATKYKCSESYVRINFYHVALLLMKHFGDVVKVPSKEQCQATKEYLAAKGKPMPDGILFVDGRHHKWVCNKAYTRFSRKLGGAGITALFCISRGVELYCAFTSGYPASTSDITLQKKSKLVL